MQMNRIRGKGSGEGAMIGGGPWSTDARWSGSVRQSSAKESIDIDCNYISHVITGSDWFVAIRDRSLCELLNLEDGGE